MKKHILSCLMLFATISIAVAQPATMTKGEVVDTLCQNRLSVEIIGINGDHFDHPCHPANGIMCPTYKSFETNGYFEWYHWESSFVDFVGTSHDFIMINLSQDGYIKVTVGDSYGHTGTDSIWFNVRNANVPPMENFIMEIDDDLHANFYGIATQEHHKLTLLRGFKPGQFTYQKDFFLSPSEWIYKDNNVTYSEDSLWIYAIGVFDICGSLEEYLVPGLLLSTEEMHLMIKSILQHENAPTFYSTEHYVYFLYTIDEYGNRHQVKDNNGNHVIIQPMWFETTAWQIPGPHIDPYYQVGVGRQLEDDSYELLSLSNKVPNPWPDIDGLDEPEKEKPFSIFPNPANGMFTVVGKGQMRVCNLFGQIILTKEIDGQMTLELPPGMYFVNIDGTTRKVLVE